MNAHTTPPRPLQHAACAATAALLLAGCTTLAPSYEAPAMPVPQQYAQAAEAGGAQTLAAHGDDLGVSLGAVRADGVGVALPEFAEAAGAGLLIAPDRAVGVAAEGLGQGFPVLGGEAGQRRRVIIAQGHPVARLVRSGVVLQGEDALVGTVGVGQELAQRLDRLDPAGFQRVEAVAVIDFGDAVQHLLAFGNVRAEIVAEPLGRLGLGSGLFFLIFRHGLPRAGPCGV